MTINRPFHRNYRQMKGLKYEDDNAYQYICDEFYAKSARHYINSFNLIVSDLKEIFLYVNPSDLCVGAFSYRMHELFMRVCIEVEANFKAILRENNYDKIKTNISDYILIDSTHHLSSYEVSLPIWEGNGRWVPFEKWKPYRGRSLQPTNSISPGWYDAYNKSKHDRQANFHLANFINLIQAVAGLLVVLTSQFKAIDLTSYETKWVNDDESPDKYALGGIFKVRYPDDWAEEEMYEFRWSDLSGKSDRFMKINYNQLRADSNRLSNYPNPTQSAKA